MVIQKKLLQIANTDIYNAYPKLKFTFRFWGGRCVMCCVISLEQHCKIMILKLIFSFKDQDINYKEEIIQSMQNSVDSLCRLIANLQNFFENILQDVNDQQEGSGVAHQFTKTAVFIAAPMEKHMQQLILQFVSSFVNLLAAKL